MRRRAAALLLAIWPSAVWAGPWGTGKGHVYLKLGTGRLRSMTLAAPDGTLFDIPRFTKDEVGVFGAYGLTDRLTVFTSLPLLRSSHLEEFRRETGVGDVQLGLQHELARRGGWVLAVRGAVQAPTGDETRAEGLLPTGSGVWEGEAAFSVGRSLAGGKGYAFAEAGHQVRGGPLRDAFTYGAQVGWNASRRLVLAANVRGVEPYDQSARDTAVGSPVGLSDRVTYLLYGPTVIVSLGRGLAVQVDLEAAARARNLARGLTWRAGLSLSR